MISSLVKQTFTNPVVQNICRSQIRGSMDKEAKRDQSELEEAHRKAFDIVCEAIQRDVLTTKKVVKLSDLRQIYIANLQINKYPNPDYRSNNLKLRLENHEPFMGRL